MEVPDDCSFAESDTGPVSGITTVTVMKTDEGDIDFAVGPENFPSSEIAEKLTSLIDARLADLPSDRRVVTLRIDKDIRFADAQYALAAVATSWATDIKLATLKDKRDQ